MATSEQYSLPPDLPKPESLTTATENQRQKYQKYYDCKFLCICISHCLSHINHSGIVLQEMVELMERFGYNNRVEPLIHIEWEIILDCYNGRHEHAKLDSIGRLKHKWGLSKHFAYSMSNRIHGRAVSIISSQQ
jgi:hypothetical protein